MLINLKNTTTNLKQGKIKKFDYVAKYDGLWHDVCSINKKNQTIRLYDQYGVFTIALSQIEDLKSNPEFDEYTNERFSIKQKELKLGNK